MSGPELRFRGALGALAPGERRALVERPVAADPSVRARVAEIVERVRAGGDAALFALARELDGVALASLEVPLERCRTGLAGLPGDLRRALERAARNLETAHRAQRPRPVEVETEPGVVVGRRPDPLARVGLYAPGGRASYPSSVLMGAVPARVAGVGEIVLCSPPGPGGEPAPAVLAAAALAGVDRVFALGGAGAIAALALGTETVPRVDRVVGPGNAYVAEAKLQLAGAVGIDSPAGPSELLVVADAGADPAVVAREMVAQAEHGPDSCAVAVVVGEALAAAVSAALAAALAGAARRELVARALAAHGGVLAAASLDEALAFANEYAAEHLLLAVADPRAALARVRGAGAVFLGATSAVPFGDYLTGANHVLPTGGSARSYSGLSTLDFVRWTSWQRVDRAGAARLAGDVAVLAESEGLGAHAAAARAWAGAGPGTGAGPGAGAGGAAPRPAALRPDLFRPGYRAIERYAPAGEPVEVDLGDNVNQFGVPPAAERALRATEPATLTRYPEPYADRLRAALARYAGVEPDEVVAGCGSDDLIDAALRAFAEGGDRVAQCDPSFSMVPAFARANGLEPVAVPFASGNAVDVEALLAARARVVYLCSPNNPTGTVAARAAVEEVLARAGGLVLLDEAYAEFAGESWASAAPARGNLLVLRTLSKAFGLAGLRVGYAVGDRALVAELEKARGPYRVSGPAERTALAALTEDVEWMRARAAEAVACRGRLRAGLTALGFAPLPSAANFLLVPVPDAKAAAAVLARAGIGVRAFPGLSGIGDALRITAAPWPVMERVLAAAAAFAPRREVAR